MLRRSVALGCGAALWWVAQTALASSIAETALVHHEVLSIDGVPLNVVESGNPNGEPLLLLHGFSQSYLSWLGQLGDPTLQARFRIVAMDLRGHGGSGKPWASVFYAGHKVWADDIHAVIQQLELERPWIVGWSFGGYVAMDFVREYGEAATRGVLLVGSHGGLLPRPAGEPAALVGDLQKSIDASLQFMNFMAAKPLSDEVIARGRYAYVMMPDYARRAMKAKRLDNTDLIDKLNLPMRFILGSADQSVPVAQVRARVASKPSIDLRVYEGVGHSAFIEAPDRFNQDLIQFTERE
ncbi:MAG: alpha/beta hydrolase [Steroidobacteraceae bacterium]|nr:alpha/beta hydrolase [Steroidobacteraceae bacterium]